MRFASITVSAPVHVVSEGAIWRSGRIVREPFFDQEFRDLSSGDGRGGRGEEEEGKERAVADMCKTKSVYVVVEGRKEWEECEKTATRHECKISWVDDVGMRSKSRLRECVPCRLK